MKHLFQSVYFILLFMIILHRIILINSSISVWLLVVMNRITCFNPGGISFRSVDCLFKGDRRV